MRRYASLLALTVLGAGAQARADAAPATCAYLPQDIDALAARGLALAAREKYRACAQSCDGEDRALCAARLQALEKQLPRLRIVVRDKDGKPVADAQVTLDGVDARGALSAAWDVDPGTHLVRVISPHVRGEQRLVLALGDPEKTVSFEEPRPVDPNAETAEMQGAHGPWPWVLVATGLTGVFSGILLTAAAQIGSDHAGNPNDALRNPGLGLTIGGIVTVAGGLLWHYLEPPRARPPATARAPRTWLSPWIAGNVLGAAAGRSF